MGKSILLNTDSYKVGMWAMYPDNVRNVFSYIESRGGKHRNTVFVGPQAYIKEYLQTPLTKADVKEAVSIWTAHGLNVNEKGLYDLVNKHGGYLPLRIRSIAEGTILPVKNIMVSVEATDEEFRWLPTWIETSLLRAVWYPTTVATEGFHIKQDIRAALEKTGDVAGLNFKLHDFGARGTSSYESSVLGGMAHLVNFAGTDTIAGVRGAMKYYGADVSGFSIPASEHSISTSWGRENEAGYVRQMIKASANQAIFANVADTYNVFEFVKMLGNELREDVIALGDAGRTMVVRPDSGDPVEVPVKVIEMLLDLFGFEVNRKGFKVLPPFIRVIQGDGIERETIQRIIALLISKGISVDNIAFGMGGKLLGAPQRDDQKFAMKASAINVDGDWKGIAKDPITDPGKSSKQGRLTLVESRGLGSISVQTVDEKHVGNRRDLMKTIFENGELKNEISFEQVRKNAKF